MTREELRKPLTASPFRPFRIHRGDGRALEVPHPDFAALHPAGRTLVVFGPKEEPFEIVDVMLITSIEVGHGTRRRKK